jgi:hypothetical protein
MPIVWSFMSGFNNEIIQPEVTIVSGFKKTKYFPFADWAPKLFAPPKPRFDSEIINLIWGKIIGSFSAVPSLEWLSTTMISESCSSVERTDGKQRSRSDKLL